MSDEALSDERRTRIVRWFLADGYAGCDVHTSFVVECDQCSVAVLLAEIDRLRSALDADTPQAKDNDAATGCRRDMCAEGVTLCGYPAESCTYDVDGATVIRADTPKEKP